MQPSLNCRLGGRGSKISFKSEQTLTIISFNGPWTPFLKKEESENEKNVFGITPRKRFD